MTHLVSPQRWILTALVVSCALLLSAWAIVHPSRSTSSTIVASDVARIDLFDDMMPKPTYDGSIVDRGAITHWVGVINHLPFVPEAKSNHRSCSPTGVGGASRLYGLARIVTRSDAPVIILYNFDCDTAYTRRDQTYAAPGPDTIPPTRVLVPMWDETPHVRLHDPASVWVGPTLL